MYASKHFIKEEMVKYDIIPNNDNNDWTKIIAYFTNIYVVRKEY